MPNDQIPSFDDMGIEHVSIREAREKFAPLLAGVATTSEWVVITRHGKPYAAIVDTDALGELNKLDHEKLSAFALTHHESVEKVNIDHVSTQEAAAKVLETNNIHCFSDTGSEGKESLENQVVELQQEIEELYVENARLEGMVEAHQNISLNLPPSAIGKSNLVVFSTTAFANRKRLRCSHSSRILASKGKAYSPLNRSKGHKNF